MPLSVLDPVGALLKEHDVPHLPGAMVAYSVSVGLCGVVSRG